MQSFRRLPWLRSVAAASCTLLFLSAAGRAQSLESTLQQFNAVTVKGYIQPMADMFGANMNAGMFHSAEIGRSGFHLSFEIVGMGAMVGDNQKTYTVSSPAGFNPPTFQTATIFGGKGGLVTDAGTGFTYRGSDGFINTTLFPLAAPQLTIGDLFGTRAVVRFLPAPAFGDQYPKSSLWGIGVQHSISQYLTFLPIPVAAHYFYNKYSAGDLVNCSGTSIGLDASKKFSVLSVYGGIAWEKSSMELKYTPVSTQVLPVDITMDGANNFRATIGIGLHLGFFSVFGDANFGTITNISAGIGFGG